jgi:hypothetical protein
MRPLPIMEVWVKGIYREFVAPERLVFSLWFVDAGGAPVPHPMFPIGAIILRLENGGTRHAGKVDTAMDGGCLESAPSGTRWLGTMTHWLSASCACPKLQTLTGLI